MSIRSLVAGAMVAGVLSVGSMSCREPSRAATRPAPTTLRIAASVNDVTEHEADTVFRTAVVAYQHRQVLDFIWDGLFADHRVGDVLLEPKWEVILPSRNLEDLKKRMRSMDELVLRVIAAGGRVQLNFQCVPRWLSSDPRNERNLLGNEKIWYSVPPSDYRRWQELVRAFVHHFNNELATHGRVHYVIGNEPDNYWLGSEQEFLRYYEHAVRGALEADPAARIGGITPSSHDASIFSTTGKRTADGRPLLYNWIRYSREKNLPLHMVTWHSYPAASPVPGTTTFWGRAARDVRRWLDEFGYKDVELHISDWPEWEVHPENDTEFKASWVASGLISMLGDGLYNPTYLALRDTEVDREQSRQNASFGGGNGLVTMFGLRKPVYDVYRLFSRLEGRIVTIDTGDEFLQAIIAVESADRIAVLLSHFIPSPWLAVRNILDERLDPDRMKREFEKFGRNDVLKSLRQAMEGTLSIDDLKVSDGFKDYLRALRSLYEKGRTRVGAPIEIQLTLSDIDAGAWRRRDTVIDREHGNLFHRRQEIMSLLAPAVQREDRVTARRLVLKINEEGAASSEPRDPVSVQPDSRTLRLDATMSSHSVVLIELSRTRAGPEGARPAEDPLPGEPE